MAELERTDKPVNVLVKEFGNGTLGVPEIQRGYVWNSPKAKDLIDSIYKKYPSGLILLWKPNQMPSLRSDSKINQSKKPDYLILDGQQRITALYKIMTGEIDVFFNILSGEFQVSNRKIPMALPWVAINMALNETFKLLGDASIKLKLSGSQKDIVEKNLQKLIQINFYTFPVTIMHTEDYFEVTESFVRLNSNGTRLKKTELAMAKLAFHWPGAIINEFDKALDGYSNIGYDIESTILMRCFITIGKSRAGKLDLGSIDSMFSVDRSELMETWKKTKKALNDAINFLKNNVGIESSKYLTSEYIFIPLVLFFYKMDGKNITERDMSALLLWFFITTIYSRFTGRIANLYKDAKAMISENMVDELIKNLREDVPSFVITPDMVKGTYHNSNMTPLLLVVLCNNEAKDWFTGITIKMNNVGSDNQIEMHHIFPKSFLKKLNYSSQEVDDISNIAFLSRKINNKISDSSPIEYLKQIDESRLMSQLVPTYKELWREARFRDFCEERRKLIAAAINEFLGKHYKNIDPITNQS